MRICCTVTQRARWTSWYEKGLVDALTEYNLPQYHGQNGWTSEGWNRIVKDLNTQFPEAKLTKSQVQGKEGQLKKDYKVVKSIINRGGISWNPTTYMINTTVEKWDEIVEEDSKLRRFEGKSFPYFEALDLLYEGNIAQARLCLTSSQPPPSTSRKRQRDESHRMRNLPPRVGIMINPRMDSDPLEDEGQNIFSDVERMGASGRNLSYQSYNDEERVPLGGDEDQDVHMSCDPANSKSGNSGAQSARPEKQKVISSFSRVEETMQDFVKLNREQAERTSINSRTTILHSMLLTSTQCHG
ncbi:unnamed protein product [Alopecurus aequalis]